MTMCTGPKKEVITQIPQVEEKPKTEPELGMASTAAGL